MSAAPRGRGAGIDKIVFAGVGDADHLHRLLAICSCGKVFSGRNSAFTFRVTYRVLMRSG
jgi:hypothetical protein